MGTHLFSEGSIRGVALKNRIVRSATWEGMCDSEGSPTGRLIDLYRALCRGGVGLIVTGYTAYPRVIDFKKFLEVYPKYELADNAQFWIGECYYFEKKYEKAIIEYEKVTKNFPDGNKVPYAFLKQGLSFLKLGDKASAKLLLQQVIKDFPNTSQARIARAKLLEIK